MNITRQEVEICIQKLSTRSFHHLPRDLQEQKNDLYRMFLEKSKSMSLQQHQMRACSSRNSDEYNFENNDRFIRIRITSYFNATTLFAFKSIKFEIFRFTHARENLSRQFSILIHFLISRFSKLSSTLFNSRTLSKAFCHLLN